MLRKFLVIIMLFHAHSMLSQDTIVQKKDIKVGLVLSGGGAKGFAHIGVLKVLEEAGVQIDYIGGTSAGAIIGALYSSGYTASQLDSILTTLDYNELMQDKLPRKSKSIYQKENGEKYAFSLPIKNRKVALPSAVSKGQNFFNVMSKLTEHVHDIDDFSKLPIPFFCVATNLENGNIEILEKGFLPEALRASGSFPTLLDPVEIDGKLLTDGGVVNNFPVDIMKEKGVDMIIGIDVQDKLESKANLNTAPRIIMQIVGFQMYDDDRLKIKETDLYMHPDISEYNVVSFDVAKQIINKGEEVARKQMSYLKEIANKQTKSKTIVAEHIIYQKDKKFRISDIKISGNKNYTKEYILGKLKIIKSDSITYEKFYEGIDNLSATDNFKSIYYKFVKQEEGTEIHFNLKEEEVSTFLKLSVHYDDLYKTGVLLNITSKHALFKNDVFSADLILGDNIRYNIDYFIDNGFHWSYGINTRYNGFNKSFFINIDEQPEVIGKTPIEYNDFTTQLFLQTNFSKNIALRIGVENKFLRVFTETLENNEISKNYFDKSNYLGAFARLQLDTYDNKHFTKKGVFLDVNYKMYLLSSDFNNDFTPFSQLYGKFGYAHTFFDKLTMHYISEAGITIGNNDNGIFDYLLGGNNENFVNNFVPFYGYEVADLSESAFLKSALTFRYELFEKNYASFTGNFARVDSDLLNDGDIFANTKSGYAIGYGLDSFIGPIEIKYTWSPDNTQNYWFFNVGFWF
ncbi:MAG: patatin-like phospholipase family protein [Flavobacteriaceae bacterium]|nr:patatin-like phospholipase family protein [Flavobacteriaceae bacterium]